jgi:hypothetical protein
VRNPPQIPGYDAGIGWPAHAGCLDVVWCGSAGGCGSRAAIPGVLADGAEGSVKKVHKALALEFERAKNIEAADDALREAKKA